MSEWYNLTEAILNRRKIDPDKLEGSTARCVKSSGEEIHGVLERNPDKSELVPFGWFSPDSNCTYSQAFYSALSAGWTNRHGWTIFIDSDPILPLDRGQEMIPNSIALVRNTSTGVITYAHKCSKDSLYIFTPGIITSDLNEMNKYEVIKYVTIKD